MTQHADADTRRGQVASALVTVVAERGLARTTLADVARTAGVSVGLVQRYFRSKDELLRFGIEYVYRRAEERAAAVPVRLPIREFVVRLMEMFLPMTDERGAELRVWLSFVQASLTDPGMAAIHRDTTARLLRGVEEALRGAQRAGELGAGVDVEAEAAALVAFVDGLSLHHAATGDGFDASSISAALAAYVDRLFGR
ncbi:TetR family transcriptional regulator [Actinomadura soli]|uniref:TetR family transcriptional regulator n=1 Tax=Actinomadura soli TaxID=2508997 RepID=A0A5C4JK17_9ACTN|nr:TetR family transcriptional regulator C-terminal domain-containing protein [Actinomadura soli]TMR07448.1 TetR family transcriptional regulator [Actinomadura soli]